MDYPDTYSDFEGLSQPTKSSWEGRKQLYSKWQKYFDGTVFDEALVEETSPGEDTVKLYPVGINLARAVCLAHADAMFGEFEEEVVSFLPRMDDPADNTDVVASKIASGILTESGSSLLWELELDRLVYGGCALMITPSAGAVKWSRIQLPTFYPVWDPEDVNSLLEAYLVYDITREQAKARYNYNTDRDTVSRIDHWTRFRHESKIDGKRIDQFSGANIWGVVPIEYIPRIRTTDWYGDSLVDDLIEPMDEINGRVADIADSINYNCHPVRYGINLPRSFDSTNYPLEPNAMWDLGDVIGNSPAPQVGMLEAKNPVPEAAFKHIDWLYDWSLSSSFLPSVALGSDSGGSQRSGITVELRLQAMVRAIRRSRLYMADGLTRGMRTSALILRKKELNDVYPARALDRLIKGQLVPKFAPILPRDRSATVDEVQKGMSTNPPSISLETAVKKLGYGAAEVKRIVDMLSDESFWQRASKPKVEPIGKNSASGADPRSE